MMRRIVSVCSLSNLIRATVPVVLAISGALVAPAFTAFDTPLRAASDEGCEGGGFSIVLQNGTVLSGALDTTVAAASLGTSFLVKGKYIEFEVVSATLGVNNYLFTGAANPRDITGGMRTVVYSRKTPDHRGLTLTSRLTVEAEDGDIELNRTGPGLSMKIQAKDCATGGLFQMEPERGDGTFTDITHVLSTAQAPTGTQFTVFYFDNPNFRAREGDFVPYKDTTVQVTARVNFGNDFSRKFVGRDSPQVAARRLQGCVPNQILKRDGTFVNVDHCGGVSVWRVESGGRMGAVFGEDAIEVAPPATVCTHQCQAQNRVRGRSTKLGFPFPVPDTSRLKPRFPANFIP